MNYDESLDFLFNRLQSFHNAGAVAYKPGLEKAFTLSAAFGNPHTGFRSIHVGGTNGKGSTAHSLASVLMSAGLKVGLYTSPHLVDFRERIRIDGSSISSEEVVDFVERYLSLNLAGCDPSFFELTTIMAFEHFARNQVDVAVIEVGLGGRLDTTNIITPLLSVITNISFDHTALLGNTLAKIAAEKAGIIKPGVPAVIGRRNPETDPVFTHAGGKNVVFAEDTPCFSGHFADEDFMTYRDTPWGDVQSCLTGDCQPENMRVVLNSLRLLEKMNFVRLDNEIVNSGLKNVCSQTGLLGRWMKINSDALVIADTAHNVDGWVLIAKKLESYLPRPLHIVIGFVNDKDYGSILSMLPTQARYYFVSPSVARAEKASAVQSKAAGFCLRGDVYDSVGEGFRHAYNEAADLVDAVVYVGGSTFVVADFLSYLAATTSISTRTPFGSSRTATAERAG